MSLHIVEKFFNSISNRDVDTAMSLLTDDHVSHDHGTGMVMTGIEENRADMENWLSMMSDMKVEILNSVESGNCVAVEMRMTGVNTGELMMPDGTKVPATGKSVEMHGCNVIEFDGEKMSKSTQYYSMMSMMAQLGLMP
tara:strand:+ start:20 stop:436 length:417 start_codon:yes stop_codon:yes gene_type:complete